MNHSLLSAQNKTNQTNKEQESNCLSISDFLLHQVINMIIHVLRLLWCDSFSGDRLTGEDPKCFIHRCGLIISCLNMITDNDVTRKSSIKAYKAF